MTAPQSPTDFPIPPDVEGFWAWEKAHFPRPQTALTEELFLKAIQESFSTAMDEWACPFGVGCRAINYYGFFTLVPFDLGTETMEGRNARYQRTLSELLPRMGESWEREWLPPMLPDLDRGRTTDYASLDDRQLLATFDEMIGQFNQRYVVHGRINFVTISASWFADFYNEAFEPEDPTEPYLLIQGFPTRSVDAGRGLWGLGRTIKNSPSLNIWTAPACKRIRRCSTGRSLWLPFPSPPSTNTTTATSAVSTRPSGHGNRRFPRP